MKTLGRFLYRLTSGIIPYLPGWSSERVRVLLFDDKGNVLLVRSWLSRQQWTLPGGGVDKGESHEEACVREIREETGFYVEPAGLEFIAMLRSDRMRADLPVFIAHIEKPELLPLAFPYNLEIIDRAWYPVQHLPPDVSQHTIQALELALMGKN